MFVRKWHSLLNMTRHDQKWHEDDITDEYKELLEAKGLFHRWSEYSDVAYTYSRASWDNCKVTLPISRVKYHLGLIYMFPKYTLRYLFFKRAASRCGGTARAVRNPKKTEKLLQIAHKNSLPEKEFIATCQRQLKYWPLLK